METIVTGILLGGTYALVALGLTLQYGVSRIMNLASGETLVAACFIAFWLFTSYQVSPLWGLLLIAPAAFVINWAIYTVLLRPLVERAKNEGMLEVDSILATFGLLFLFQGLMLRGFGGAYTSYSYLAERFDIFGTFYGLNRVVAFAAAFLIASASICFCTRRVMAPRSAPSRSIPPPPIWSGSMSRVLAVQRRGHRLRLRDRPAGRRPGGRGAHHRRGAGPRSATRRCSTTSTASTSRWPATSPRSSASPC